MMCILFGLMIPSSALADEVRLRNGDVLAGIVLHSSDEQIILDHPDLGRLTIPAQAVDSFSVTAAPKERKTADSADSPNEGSRKKGTGKVSQPEDDWSLSVVFEGSFSNDDEGEKVSFHTRGKAERKVPDLETGRRVAR